MVDVVHFNVGVESKLPDFDKIYMDVFPRVSNFKPSGTRIEKHLETFFNKYPSTSEVLIKNIQPQFMRESITRPYNYNILMRSIHDRFKAVDISSLAQNPTRQKKFRRGLKVIKKLQSNNNELMLHLTKQLFA